MIDQMTSDKCVCNKDSAKFDKNGFTIGKYNAVFLLLAIASLFVISIFEQQVLIIAVLLLVGVLALLLTLYLVRLLYWHAKGHTWKCANRYSVVSLLQAGPSF